MLVLPVRHHDASIQVTVRLSPFVADWPAAQQEFIGGLAAEFRDWHPIGPEDFTITPALSLGDLRCRCRLFGGSCSIALAPDTLHLSFSNVRRRNSPMVLETVRRSLHWLANALGEHGRDWMSFDTRAHMQALDGTAVDAYLGRFMSGEIDSIIQSDEPWSLTSGSSAPYEHPRADKSGWLPDALRALAGVDQEIAEDGLPEINTSTRKEAKRIIAGLAGQPCAPTVYPTQDAEIAIHFKSPDLPSSVVILLNNHGQGECYAYTGGNSRRAHYETSSDLPDSFIREQLRALTPEKVAAPVRPAHPPWMLVVGMPTAL